MKIIFINDGKQKHQSHEARLETAGFQAMHHWIIDATGYGTTKEEALTNLQAALTQIQFEISTAE